MAGPEAVGIILHLSL